MPDSKTLFATGSSTQIGSGTIRCSFQTGFRYVCSVHSSSAGFQWRSMSGSKKFWQVLLQHPRLVRPGFCATSRSSSAGIQRSIRVRFGCSIHVRFRKVPAQHLRADSMKEIRLAHCFQVLAHLEPGLCLVAQFRLPAPADHLRVPAVT